MSRTWKNEYSKPQKRGKGKKWRLHWGWSRRRMKPYGMLPLVGYAAEFYRPGKRNPIFVNLGMIPGDMIFALNNKPKERRTAKRKIWEDLVQEFRWIDTELWRLEKEGKDFDSISEEDFLAWIRLGRMLRFMEDEI